MRLITLPVIALFLLTRTLFAQELTVQQVTDHAYAIIGPTSQRSPENLGNNATFGLIVTNDGAVLIDPGGSFKGAQALHEAIKTVTDQPVKAVINSGGQDHRWLGNGYWHDQGATIYASDAAVADQKDRVSQQLTGLSTLIGTDALAGTDPYYADTTFDAEMTLEIGDVTLFLTHGAAHTPGDSTIWMPSESVMFTGDLVYIDRILGVGPQSSSLDWVASFDVMAAQNPAHIVPGHGRPADLARATADTYDYLTNLRTRIGALIEEGGDIIAAPKVDQSAFAYLQNFDGLAGRNAQEVFSQMEWE
ncbi:MAG TPA: MBL fold metallo-hydrolase [Aliiroseovarius sp.]|nr:MBL fold metallo-hydrolase [Aliiroseovarius sp.]